MNKKSLLSAFLTVILFAGVVLASALRFGTVQASTDVSGIPKPSVPEFTVKVIDNPYYVSPKYSTPDTYTGETTLVDDGDWDQNGTIELTIKNQPLAFNNDGEGHVLYLFYTIESKGNFEGVWDEYPALFYGEHKEYLPASNSDVTVVNVMYGRDIWSGRFNLGEIPTDGQVDFRVQAFIGYNTTLQAYHYDLMGTIRDTYYYQNYTGQASDWSNIQTIAIPESQTPTSSPVTSELDNAIVGAAIVAIVLGAALGLLVYFKKRKREAYNHE